MYLGRKEGLPLAAAINGVMLERVATLTGLIFLVVVTQPLLLSRLGDHRYLCFSCSGRSCRGRHRAVDAAR